MYELFEILSQHRNKIKLNCPNFPAFYNLVVIGRFIIWQNYRIPRENLLNKTGDVTEDGRYITPFRDSNKRHGASLGYLSIGRVNITNVAAGYGIKALTIAVRYAAVRKQFGPNNDAEMPILEYQTHVRNYL
ncbi:hypothetical protein HHI36_007948 [Cryptolaemus montrouzieri]|uniref:Acyl-CoA oxidase C-alpha1 domain-containing protein n=1 Tax=Cryptolaemus montrouzieri TaxID=559131 RepID=A0ABD2MR43_9CUCU